MQGNSKVNKYVQSATINGRDITKTLTFTHDELRPQGKLVIVMGPKPRS